MEYENNIEAIFKPSTPLGYKLVEPIKPFGRGYFAWVKKSNSNRDSPKKLL